MQRRGEAGFTLLELMVVIALIAILATVALPSLFGESRRARGLSEVQSIFQDLRNRMEQYAQEKGTYPPGDGEGTLNPAAPTPTPKPFTMNATWTAANVRITNTTEVSCGYTWSTGGANDATNIGAEATAFGFTAPATAWYYLLAQCDLDGDSGTDSYYFTSSVDPTILKRNEGY